MNISAQACIFLGLYLILAYLIGAIPTGYWLAKRLKGIDLRMVGSGSTGATNVYRSVGKTAGIAVFGIDFLKGYFPVFLSSGALVYLFEGKTFSGGSEESRWIDSIFNLDSFPIGVATATLIGHSRSIFLGFKGGKSAATGLGTLFALDFRVGLFTFISWMIILFISKMVSVASILATAICIPLMIFFRPLPSYIIYCVFGFAYVTLRHKANIGRVLAGTEPKIGGN